MVKEDKNKNVKKSSTKTEVKKTTPVKKEEVKKTAPVKKEEVKKETVMEKQTVSKKEEDTSYTKTILAAILIILVLIGGYVGFKIKNAKDEESTKINDTYTPTTDEKKFKDEYESLNGTARSNGSNNRTVSIIDDNNVQYLTVDQAADIMENGSGVIFFGFAACPWCRNAVPILLKAMSNSNLDTIYYVDVRPNDDKNKDIRDEYSVEKGKLYRVKEASSERYYDILEMLDDYLNDYEVTDDKDKLYKTGEKRLGAPSVVAVNNGTVVGFHAGTLPEHKRINGVLDDLTDEQVEKVYNIYASLIQDYLGDSCTEDTQC